MDPRYHFLNGIRGIAAISVIYTHSHFLVPDDNIKKPLASIGCTGVIAFFCLSAFLLTYRSLVEWNRLVNQRNSTVRSASDVELSVLPSLSDKTSTADIPAWPYLKLYFFSESKIKCRFWLRFYILRFFRIYPSYIVALALAFCLPRSSVIRFEDEFFQVSSFLSNLLLYRARSIFWTISMEFAYYLLIPIYVIIYHSLTSAFIKNKSLKLALSLFIFCSLSAAFIAASPRDSDDMVVACCSLFSFLLGSAAGCIWAEILDNNFLKISNSKTNFGQESTKKHLFLLRNLSKMQLIIASFDALCYGLLLFILFLQPTDEFFSPASKYSWWNNTNFGILVAPMILLGLVSNASFNKIFRSNLLQFAGRISFSLYLTHYFVISFIYWNKKILIGLEDKNGDDYYFFIYFYPILFSWILSIIWHFTFENPTQKIGQWLADKVYSLKKIPK